MFEPLLTAVAAARSIAAYVLVSLYVLVVAPPGIVIAILTGRPWLLYWLGRQGVRLGLVTVGIRYRVVGADHVDRERASVYCVNHASNLEPPVVYMALAAAHPKLRILYKAEIHKIPILSTVFDTAGFVPIQRRHREQSRVAIETAAAALRAGNSFLIFRKVPEVGLASSCRSRRADSSWPTVAEPPSCRWRFLARARRCDGAVPSSAR